MAVDFSDFSPSSTIPTSAYFVGYEKNESGGERKWTYGTLRSELSAQIIPSGVTSTEIGYLNGVTSNIQTQLDGKQATITGAATTIATSNLTVSRALVSDGNGKVDVSDVTSTELGYLDGVTSSIQTQLNAVMPAGAVMSFARSTAPSGWLDANGSAVSRVTYATLFAAIGTTYGAGDGSTTFNLPDLRGYFIRGTGTNSDGIASGTFAAKQAAAILNHTHDVSGTTSSSGSHTHNIGARQDAAGGGSGAYINYNTNINVATSSAGAHTHTFSDTSSNPSVGGGTETRPANIALLYCIKF